MTPRALKEGTLDKCTAENVGDVIGSAFGMPRREADHWHIPDARELAEAKAALTVLVERAKKNKA